MEAAFKPQVNDELDTQNFMKFEEVSKSFFSFVWCMSRSLDIIKLHVVECGLVLCFRSRVCVCVSDAKHPCVCDTKHPCVSVSDTKRPCLCERVTQSTCVYVTQSARVCEVCWGLYALSLAPFFFLFSEITRSCPACLWKWTVYVFLSFVYYTCHLRPSILFCSLTLLQQGQVLGLQGRYAPYT